MIIVIININSIIKSSIFFTNMLLTCFSVTRSQSREIRLDLGSVLCYLLPNAEIDIMFCSMLWVNTGYFLRIKSFIKLSLVSTKTHIHVDIHIQDLLNLTGWSFCARTMVNFRFGGGGQNTQKLATRRLLFKRKAQHLRMMNI